MQKNLVLLIGNLGDHAKAHTDKNNRSFTTFSLATSARYKNKAGEYVTITEWHRCIVFGPGAEVASKLEKGAYIILQGSIRHSEYKGTKRDSIVVSTFLQLARAQKVPTDEMDHEEIPEEAVAE